MKIIHTSPVLPARDIESTIRFYEEKLGFRKTLEVENVCVLVRDAAERHFMQCAIEDVLANSACRLQIEGIGAFFERCKADRLIDADAEMEIADWGKIFPLIDPNGNLLWFIEYEGESRPLWAWDRVG
jgi:catechol 2,3-dioxygenase-like lactoylglutathione lyase family enzyme